MIEISHLVVDGCSLAYCQGLENPHIDGWPALLAKKIGVPVVNLALGGASMDAIHRRQFDYFYESDKFYKQRNVYAKPFHIISLTYATRREEFFQEHYTNHETNRYWGLDLSPDLKKLEKIISSLDISPKNIPAYVEYAHFMNLNLYPMTLRKLHYWDSIRQLYQNKKINYAVIDYMPTLDPKVDLLLQANHYDVLESLYNDVNYYGDVSVLTKDYPKLPCMHDGLEAQKVLCDYIYHKMINCYEEIVPVPCDNIYKLGQYYKDEGPYRMAQWTDWLKV